MQARRPSSARFGLFAIAAIWLLIVVPLSAMAAPFAAHVIDARSGKVLYARNADTRLHPASLTKMMTLYIAFEAVENGEISLDTKVTISKRAAAEPPSKLGLKAGQKIALRYLIRGAAVKSANDAATAIGEAISGSEAKFARRMNRTAKTLGMTRTTFKNMHGLTEAGHLSTARDMTLLGRQLLYDYPEYYNLFSRITADAGVRKVAHTNRRFLNSYRGSDGIKTGYTRAAGFNLTASAKRGNERIIVTVFGGKSTTSRNAKVTELMDLGFRRAPSRAKVNRPKKPAYAGNGTAKGIGTTRKRSGAVTASKRPVLRPGVTAPVLVADTDIKPVDSLDIAAAVKVAVESDTAHKPAKAMTASYRPPTRKTRVITATAAETPKAETPKPTADAAPKAKASTPKATQLAENKAVPAPSTPAETQPVETQVAALPAPPKAQPIAEQATAPQEVVSRVSTSGGRHWGVNVGRYPSRYAAEKVLLKTALAEISTLEGSLRKVVRKPQGFEANFLGMTRETADLACRRLAARQISCIMIGP